MLGKKKPQVAGTPLLPGEPQSLGFQTDDSLFTIQGKVDKQTTDIRKAPEMKLTQYTDIVVKPASEQCKFFLNAYWPYLLPGEAERVYNEWKIFKIVQKESGVFAEDSASVNQALALVFLQRLKRGLSKAEFDAEFKNIDSNFDGAMAFIEYLCWDKKKTPADLLYRPQRYSRGIADGITRVMKAERELLNYGYEKKKLEDAAALPGVQGTTGQQKLAQFLVATDLKRLNGEAASAKEALLKAWTASGITEEGDKFWAAAIENEKISGLSQKAQAAKKN